MSTNVDVTANPELLGQIVSDKLKLFLHDACKHLGYVYAGWFQQTFVSEGETKIVCL